MNVAGTVFNGAGNQQVDKFDDRGVAGFVKQVGSFIDFRDQIVRRLFTDFFKIIFGGRAAHIVGQINGCGDRVLRSKDNRHVLHL